MSTNANFIQAVQKNLPTLEQYVPVVARVHGGSHPEFRDVRAVFDEIVAEIQKTGAERAVLGTQFEKLRAITGDYAVPPDVCESWEAVYAMLAELDAAYSAANSAAYAAAGRPDNG